MIEPTTLTLGATPAVACGKINTGHFDTQNDIVDVDAFAFNVPADSEALIALSGTGIEALDGVDALLVNADGDVVASATYLASHGIGFGRLPAGSYALVLFASNAAAIPASIDYKIRVVADNSTARCGKSTATPAFTEVETTPNNANDMVAVKYGSAPARQLTPAADNPEATNVTVAASMKYRLTGTSEVATNATDEYIDRDAFLVKTGPTTDQLSVRVNWDSTTADLDFMVFPAGQINEIGSGTLIGDQEDEFSTFSVLPNTDYWVWVGQYDAPGATAAPYSITLCGDAFAP